MRCLRNARSWLLPAVRHGLLMARKMFPDLADNISMALTPMVLTGRLIKKEHPGCKVVFIPDLVRPKKLEASRKEIRSDVDFVLTFEEVVGMFTAKGVDFNKIPADGNALRCQCRWKRFCGQRWSGSSRSKLY